MKHLLRRKSNKTKVKRTTQRLDVNNKEVHKRLVCSWKVMKFNSHTQIITKERWSEPLKNLLSSKGMVQTVQVIHRHLFSIPKIKWNSWNLLQPYSDWFTIILCYFPTCKDMNEYILHLVQIVLYEIIQNHSR
jgi:hypothetical protein